MRLLGANKVADLNMQHVSLFGKHFFWLKRRKLMAFFKVNARALEQQIYDGPAGFEKSGMWVSSKL